LRGWESLYGRITQPASFSQWNKKRYVELEVIMKNYEENPIAKGVLFLSSMKSQENVEQMVMQIKVQCAKQNILVEDVAVEHNLIGDMDMDRPVVKSVVNVIVNRGYEVLILRNQYDVTEDDSDWEKFVGDMADMDVRVYLADTGEFAGNAYGE
jgi:hypothetical protein